MDEQEQIPESKQPGFFKRGFSIVLILSYILVAAAASLITMILVLPKEEPLPYTEGQSKLSALEQLIAERYIGEVDITKLEDYAAQGMINSLGDRWSFYIPKSEMDSYTDQKNNSYVGIGITVQAMADGSGMNVIQVAAGGPAEAAGVLVGDIVIAVEGQSIQGMTANDVSKLIKGEVNTQVTITVLRDNTPVNFTITRQLFKTPVAVATMLENNIGLVQIKNFNANCAQETIQAIETLKEQGAQKLIFDVRFNGGGYANEMVAVLDYLLPEGDLFRTVDYTGAEAVERSDAAHLDMPMVVLVNGSSYSAAEFFAAALREYDAALVVGEQTSGKGYFQVTYMLPDGSGVALSIGKYYTPKGNCLEGVGITPDFVVGVDDATAAEIYNGTLNPMEDPQILKAIEALQSK